MQLTWQVTLIGLELLTGALWAGAILALIAAGMRLLRDVAGIINLGQGEYVMLGGFITLALARAGMPLLPALPLAALAVAIFGWALQRLLLWRVARAGPALSLLATFAVALFLQQLMLAVFGASVHITENGASATFLLDGLIMLPLAGLLTVGISLLMLLALKLFLRKTAPGQAMLRAARDNAAPCAWQMPRPRHVNRRLADMAHAINGALCGAAGALLVTGWAIHPFMGLPYTLRAFIVASLAAPSGLPLTFLAASGLSLAEQLAALLLHGAFPMTVLLVLLMGALIACRFLPAMRRHAGQYGARIS